MKIVVTKKLLNHIEKKLKCDVKSYKILGNGEHNVNYILQTSKGNFVLRIYANIQFDNSRKEYSLLRKLRGRFAPKAMYLDTTKQYIKQDYMIQEFVEGKTLSKFDEKNIVKVALLLKEIHKITDIKKSRSWDNPISSWTKNNLLNNSKFLGSAFQTEMKKLYKEILDILIEIQLYVKKYDRTSLIHDDPIPANFIEKHNGELILIDWELASFDYFFFDFGAVIAESHIDKRLEQIFLKTYGFGIKPEEKKIIQAINISRILSVIGWLIERLAMEKQGKDSFALQDNKKYSKRLADNLKYIRLRISQIEK